jgi:hypothetical protein
MRLFMFNIASILCLLFIFSVTASSHPHKSGEINHGPSLENYQIELSFSTEHLMSDGSKPNVKIATKNKQTAPVTKPDKNKTTLDKEQTKNQQKGQKK